MSTEIKCIHEQKYVIFQFLTSWSVVQIVFYEYSPKSFSLNRIHNYRIHSGNKLPKPEGTQIVLVPTNHSAPAQTPSPLHIETFISMVSKHNHGHIERMMKQTQDHHNSSSNTPLTISLTCSPDVTFSRILLRYTEVIRRVMNTPPFVARWMYWDIQQVSDPHLAASPGTFRLADRLTTGFFKQLQLIKTLYSTTSFRIGLRTFKGLFDINCNGTGTCNHQFGVFVGDFKQGVCVDGVFAGIYGSSYRGSWDSESLKHCGIGKGTYPSGTTLQGVSKVNECMDIRFIFGIDGRVIELSDGLEMGAEWNLRRLATRNPDGGGVDDMDDGNDEEEGGNAWVNSDCNDNDTHQPPNERQVVDHKSESMVISKKRMISKLKWSVEYFPDGSVYMGTMVGSDRLGNAAIIDSTGTLTCITHVNGAQIQTMDVKRSDDIPVDWTKRKWFLSISLGRGSASRRKRYSNEQDESETKRCRLC